MGEIITKNVHPSKLFSKPKAEQIDKEYLSNEKAISLINCHVNLYRHPDGYIYKCYSYTEDGELYTNLLPLGEVAYSKKQEWAFGYIDKNGEIIFLFNGNAMADSREQAKSAFPPVKKYVISNNLGEPFMYKLQS